MWWAILVLILIILIVIFASVKQDSSYVSPVPGKTIWILWLQGWDKAPWLVQKVRESWKKLNPEWNVELVDERNLNKYVKISYIDKITSPAAKSDAIRLNLLETHGGVWADATLLCMHPLDDWIYEALEPAGFWMYHGRDKGEGPASWFIISIAKSPLISKWKKACDEYWSSRNKEDEYFWMDSLFKKLRTSDDEFRSEWASVPYLWCDAEGQSHMLAGKTQENTQELKQILKENPPYVVKLSRGSNNIEFSEHMTDSNAYFAIQSALEQEKAPYKLHTMINKSDKGFKDSVVVVADCGNQEDLSRVMKETDYELVVYDKCNFCKTRPDSVQCRPRKNVGREQETFLHFVTTYFDKLPKNIIFLPTPIDKHDRFERFKHILKTGENKFHQGLMLNGQEDFELPEYEGRRVTRAVVTPFKNWYETYITDWNPNTPLLWNGIYKTSRDRILEKPLYFFTNLHKQSQVANDCEVAHYLERSMTSIY
jgi:hypothetical protein